jgi:ABC-type multidrug transport system fused ATPase/permease subunit
MMKATGTYGSWRWLWRYVRKVRLAITVCIVLALIESLSLVPVAWLVKFAFDRVIPSHDSARLIELGCGLLALVLCSSAITMTTRFASLRTTKRIIGDLRSDLLVHLCTMEREFFDTADHGELHTLVVEDTQLVDVMMNALIANFIPSLVLGSVLVIILGAIDLKLLLFLSLVMPVMLIVHRRLGTRAKTTAKANRNAYFRFSGGVQSLLMRMNLTKAHGAEEFEVRIHHRNIDDLRSISEKMAWSSSALSLSHAGIVTVASVAVLVIGGLDVAANNMSMGSLMSFYVVMMVLASRMQQLFSTIPQLVEGRHALDALTKFSTSMIAPNYTGTRKIDFEGSIEFRDVSFGYNSTPVLENVSLQLNSGLIVAISGNNGSGKSTLSHLILGLYRPQRGVILADGIPYDALDVLELRRAMAVAAQDPLIFAGSIWENITYGMDDSNPHDVEAACSAALLDSFISRLPEGYDTRVDERGGVLSGGERQKISIARALVRKPQILILDEPTNHLDPDSVRSLLSNLSSIADHPTVLVITQDPRVLDAIPIRLHVENRTVKGHNGSTSMDRLVNDPYRPEDGP